MQPEVHMKTALITISELRNFPDRGYPVHIFVDEGTDPDWRNKVLAESVIPEDLSLPNPPLDPETGNPLEAKKIREILLAQAGNSPRFRAIGEYLFQLLGQGQVGEYWKSLREKYPREQAPSEGLRTILDVKSRRLRFLPWELMCSDKRRLFVDPANPFLRGHNIDFDWKESIHSWPIRGLIVVGCKADDEVVKADEELLAIMDAFRSPVLSRIIEWEILERPSKQRLVKIFDDFKPHIFHFIGHGGKEPGSGEPVLEFYTESDGDRWRWTVDQIVNDLAGWAPRFAFINACRSNDPIKQENTWAITDAFIEAGVVAVLGVQGDIIGVAAARFAAVSYCALARGELLDCALAQARKEVINMRGSSLDHRDWALPSLFLSIPPEQMLPMRLNITEELRRKIELCPEFTRIRDFVDRKAERRTLWRGVDPIEDEDAYQDLLVVVGEEEVGKTALVHWCMELCALRGRNLIYVDMDDEKSKNFLDLLYLIRDGDLESGSLIRQPLKKNAFDQFNWDLSYLLKGGEPLQAGRQTADQVQVVNEPLQPGNESLIPRIFSSFREALIEAADGAPLIIALDHLRAISPYEFTTFLRPYLIDCVARRDLPLVRMILVLSIAEYKYFYPEAEGGSEWNFELIKVSPFEKKDFLPLATEFCRCRKVDMVEAEEIINVLARNRDLSTWKPSFLRRLGSFIEYSP